MINKENELTQEEAEMYPDYQAYCETLKGEGINNIPTFEEWLNRNKDDGDVGGFKPQEQILEKKADEPVVEEVPDINLDGLSDEMGLNK